AKSSAVRWRRRISTGRRRRNCWASASASCAIGCSGWISMHRTEATSGMPAFHIDADGWADGAQQEPSPNCDPRADGVAVDLLVIHNISLPPGRFGGSYITDLFLNRLDYAADPYFEQLRPLRVSAHFLIRRDGAVVQFVSVNDRAWHAGASNFCGRERCNDFSIGIELEGTDYEPFEAAQYAALAALTAALQQACPLKSVTGHEHIAPGRK